MASFIPVSFSATRCIPRCGTSLFRSQFSPHQNITCSLLTRFKSGSARPPPAKSAKPVFKTTSPGNQTPRRRGNTKVDSAKKASLLLNTLRNAGQNAGQPPKAKTVVESAKDKESTPVQDLKTSQNKSLEDEVTIRIDEKEEAIQQRIVAMRRKILWPGIWTMLALVGTYGTLAYLDVKAGIPSSDGSHLPERAQLPQTWYLTPTVILEGVKAGWKELDNLTIGIVVATLATHLLKRSPLPIWENLIHVTGEWKFTAFTYPFVHSTWTHAATNMAALVWFLPGVVRYFDDDLFHTAAFLVSVPLITSYFTHFAYRFNLSSGFMMNMGASGSIAAALGIYCVAYANEKIWLPPSLVFRLDSMYWALLFVASQAYAMVKTPKGGNRPAFLVHIASLGIGAAYAYFDLKHHLWIPVVSEISARTSDTENVE